MYKDEHLIKELFDPILNKLKYRRTVPELNSFFIETKILKAGQLPSSHVLHFYINYISNKNFFTFFISLKSSLDKEILNLISNFIYFSFIISYIWWNYRYENDRSMLFFRFI